MSKADVEFECTFCSARATRKVEIPAGWELNYDGQAFENGFCPRHSIIAEWRRSQCPGCVGGWGDCDFHRAWAFESKRSLTEQDFALIEQGICPRRTNGTMVANLGPKGVEIANVDLSERASPASGRALVAAIKSYWDKYAAGTRNPHG